MKNKVNKNILNNLTQYHSLVNGRKNTTEKVLAFNSKKSSRKDLLYLESPVNHVSMQDEIILMIETKINNPKSFKFQFRCSSLCEKPFFRFDSDGAAHKNYDPSIPLKLQMVTTPHFNAYDNDGRSIAYKTRTLLDENEAKALEDINLSFVHFCFESNTRYPLDDFSEISPVPVGELGVISNNEDILSNIRFQ